MPRGLGKKIDQNPLQKSLFSKIMGNLYETKRIESATISNVKKVFVESDASRGKVFEVGEPLPSSLEDIFIDVHTTFGIDHSYKSRTILYGPPVELDKKRVYHLPPAIPGTIHRIILVSGTHEILECDVLEKLIGSQGILIPQGSAIKLTQGFTDFTYNNKGTYDKDVHPGKGIKYPEKRHLIIFDFISDKPEEVERTKNEALNKANSQASGLITNLFKSVGFGKQ